MKQRGSFYITLGLMVLLAGCGAPAALGPSDAPNASVLAAATTAPAPSISASTEALAPSSAASAAASETSGATRTVTHAMGTAEVPMNPQRVVALDAFFTLTPLIELGVPVIGSVSLGEPAQYPGLTDQESAGITSVGNGRLGNIETVATLKPDLIIGVDFVEPPYEQLQQIAPTVIIDTALDWKQQHRALGEATGTLERAEQGIAEYEARVQSLRERMPPVTASILSLLGEQPMLYTMGSQAWAPIRVLDEAGVKRPPDEVSTGDEFFKMLSLEVLPELKGDVLLYATDYPGVDAESAGYMSNVTGSPIWQQIPAVKAGKVYQVDGRCWETFGGLRSAHCVLDDLERVMIDN